MVSWQDSPPAVFDDWAEMREIYLGLLRPRKFVAPEMTAPLTRDGRPEAAAWIGGSRLHAPRHLAQGAGCRNIV